MALDNQLAHILVGQKVPRVTGVNVNPETGAINTPTILEPVGLIIDVTPRINPDGLVSMAISATNSAVGPESEGIPIYITPAGDAVRQPRIDTIEALTVVSAMDGQTVILGGLIRKSTQEVHRRVPLLSNVPVLGNLFRYDLEEEQRNELLIIMTPHIVNSEEDAKLIRQAEVARMHWCLGDVLEMTGDGTLRGRDDEWSDAETRVIYPDGDPGRDAAGAMDGLHEPVPTPDGSLYLPEPAPIPGGAAAPPSRESKRVEQAAWPPQRDPDAPRTR